MDASSLLGRAQRYFSPRRESTASTKMDCEPFARAVRLIYDTGSSEMEAKMGKTFTASDPTLGWTQSYGSASLRERAREAVRDAAFALAVLVCAAGAAG